MNYCYHGFTSKPLHTFIMENIILKVKSVVETTAAKEEHNAQTVVRVFKTLHLE